MAEDTEGLSLGFQQHENECGHERSRHVGGDVQQAVQAACQQARWAMHDM